MWGRRTSRRGLLGGAAAGAAGMAMAAPARSEQAGAPVPAHAAAAAVRAAHARHRALAAGAPAGHLPGTAKRDPDLFAIALATADGQIFAAGDTEAPFPIQAIARVANAALVLEQSGRAALLDGIGVAATGRMFAATGGIEQDRGRPMHPLLSPGSIATVSRIRAASPEAAWRQIRALHAAFAGRPLGLDAAAYRADAESGQRCRALGQWLAASRHFAMDPAVATDLHARSCAIEVSVCDLALMAATLAFGGRNPVTGQQVMQGANVPVVLAIMAGAGLYDDSGRWLALTGLPAKSGASGGLIAVSPGRFGVAAFAPRLDAAGNSVRAQRAIADIAAALDGNPFARSG